MLRISLEPRRDGRSVPLLIHVNLSVPLVVVLHHPHSPSRGCWDRKGGPSALALGIGSWPNDRNALGRGVAIRPGRWRADSGVPPAEGARDHDNPVSIVQRPAPKLAHDHPYGARTFRLSQEFGLVSLGSVGSMIEGALDIEISVYDRMTEGSSS